MEGCRWLLPLIVRPFFDLGMQARQSLQVETVISDVGRANTKMGIVGQFRSVPQMAVESESPMVTLERVFPSKINISPGEGKGAEYAAKNGYGESSPDVLISIRQRYVCQGQQLRRGLAVAIHHPHCVLTGCCQP